MYGIYTYIYQKDQPNVGKYTIHEFFRYIYSVYLHCWILQKEVIWMIPVGGPYQTQMGHRVYTPEH